MWCAIRKKWKKEKSWFCLLWCKKKKRKQKCTCTIQFIPFITLKSVRYNHSLSIKCLEWDSEVPSPGSHSWWKPGPETTSPVSHWYGNFREEEAFRDLGVDPLTTSPFSIYCFSGNSWTPLVMENSAAPKEADSCVIVIVNKNNTLWWTQFCLSNASTEMTYFWILWSDRIFKPSDNTLQIWRVSF